jgi:hypothetical protein
MTQVNSTPGVPNPALLATVALSSATPILVGPSALTGTGSITSLAEFTTETTNIWAQALAASAKIAPAHSSTPIVLGPAVFSGAKFGAQT